MMRISRVRRGTLGLAASMAMLTGIAPVASASTTDASAAPAVTSAGAPTSWLFDFGSASSPVGEGAVQVADTML